MDQLEQLNAALATSSESERVDFKVQFDPASTPEWLELLKDIVALANSGGGTILLGLDDEGKASGTDISGALDVDPADVTNKIYKYTDHQFHSFEFRRCRKESAEVCAILVGAVAVPLVFARAGNYPVEGNKQQKSAFQAGTVYFRHGAKSEPGNSDDLQKFIERRLEVIKKSWLEGIAKVVEAPPGARIAVLPPELDHAADLNGTPVRIVDDPQAPTYRSLPIDETHPYRQKEVVKLVNERLKGRRIITTHHILCVRRALSVEKNTRFCYTQRHTSAQYSAAFIDWVVASFEVNERFFDDAKSKYDEITAKKH